MSERNHNAIFERKATLDAWTDTQQEWEEVCREWVSLTPLNGREYFEAKQVQAATTHKARLTHSPTAATITTDCRMKIRKPVLVDEGDETADANYRIFAIDNIVNVREQNRELEMMVQEKV